MTTYALVIIVLASAIVCLRFRREVNAIRRSLSEVACPESEISFSQGDALQSILLLKRRMRSLEHLQRPKRLPLPPAAIPSKECTLYEIALIYFESIMEELSAVCSDAYPSLILQCESETRIVSVKKSEQLLEAVLHSLVNIDDKQYTPIPSCFERFGLKESTCEFFETPEGVKGALWIGFEDGYEPISSEIEEWKRITSEFSQRIHEVSSQVLSRINGQFASHDAFITQVSHDIRSPLNNIRSILHLFQLEGINNDGDELLSIALKNCDVMNEIVETVLDYSAQQSNKVVVNPENVLIHEIIQEVIKTYSLSARLKKLEVTFSGIETLTLRIDRRHLRRILSNLLSNAIKYTSAGKIHISFEFDKDRYGKIAIADTGIGFTSNQIGKLFEPFSRFQPGLAEGAGLGLVVTKALTEINNGTISVSSHYGTGTTFTLQFPLAIEDAPAQKLIRKELLKIAADKTRVLIVDDDADWSQSLSRCIESYGYEVYQAASTAEAIGILQVAPVDAVITDRNMPGGGNNLISYIQDRDLNLPTLIISGDIPGISEDMLYWCSAKTKPIDPHEVVDWLREIGSQRALKEVA